MNLKITLTALLLTAPLSIVALSNNASAPSPQQQQFENGIATQKRLQQQMQTDQKLHQQQLNQQVQQQQRQQQQQLQQKLQQDRQRLQQNAPANQTPLRG